LDPQLHVDPLIAMNTSNKPAIQDLYPDDLAHCYGCGRNNPNGHQLKSFSEGDEVVARFSPPPHHISIPGFVYGGLLASLADCHAMATAAAASEMVAGLMPRFVTAALRVDYLKPTPLGVELEIRGRVTERSEKKAVVAVTISANGVVTVKAEAVAVRLPKSMEPVT
jgi:acyl-coenzyme A thioesterase PaaI-like protein